METVKIHRQVWAKDQVDCSARPFGVEAAEVWSVLSRPLVGWLVGWLLGCLVGWLVGWLVVLPVWREREAG